MSCASTGAIGKFSVALPILITTACSDASPDTDLARCRVELAKLPAPPTADREQLLFVHNCMAAKDWQAPMSCVENDLLGTWMCDYKKK